MWGAFYSGDRGLVSVTPGNHVFWGFLLPWPGLVRRVETAINTGFFANLRCGREEIGLLPKTVASLPQPSDLINTFDNRSERPDRALTK
jgi:hypothetical protein